MPSSKNSTKRELKELKYLANEVITEIEDYYIINFPEDLTTDFNPLRNENEYEILQKCIKIMPHRKNKRVSHLAVISFYYLVVVSEYYVQMSPEKFIRKSDKEEYYEIFIKLSCSNEEWASKIRRIVYKFDNSQV
jgi:hypothetical protein